MMRSLKFSSVISMCIILPALVKFCSVSAMNIKNNNEQSENSTSSARVSEIPNEPQPNIFLGYYHPICHPAYYPTTIYPQQYSYYSSKYNYLQTIEAKRLALRGVISALDNLSSSNELGISSNVVDSQDGDVDLKIKKDFSNGLVLHLNNISLDMDNLEYVEYSNGIELKNNGIQFFKNGDVNIPGVMSISSSGIITLNDGTEISAENAKIIDNKIVFPSGMTVFSNGTVKFINGITLSSNGTIIFPNKVAVFKNSSYIRVALPNKKIVHYNKVLQSEFQIDKNKEIIIKFPNEIRVLKDMSVFFPDGRKIYPYSDVRLDAKSNNKIIGGGTCLKCKKQSGKYRYYKFKMTSSGLELKKPAFKKKEID